MKEKSRPVPSGPSSTDRPTAQPTRRALGLTNFFGPKTDPSGSYTGRPIEPHEQPVQDADDL